MKKWFSQFVLFLAMFSFTACGHFGHHRKSCCKDKKSCELKKKDCKHKKHHCKKCGEKKCDGKCELKNKQDNTGEEQKGK